MGRDDPKNTSHNRPVSPPVAHVTRFQIPLYWSPQYMDGYQHFHLTNHKHKDQTLRFCQPFDAGREVSAPVYYDKFSGSPSDPGHGDNPGANTQPPWTLNIFLSFPFTFARMRNLIARAGSNAGLPVPIITFDVMQSVALFVLVVVLLVVLLSRFVSRIKSWFCLLISFVVYCVSFLLLAGHQTGPEPPFGLCALQAGLIHAAPALVAAASLIFVIELYLRLTAVTLSREVNENLIYWMPWALPLVHSVAFWVALLVGLSDLKTIERHPSGLYCRVNQNIPPTFTGTLVVLLAGLMVILEVYTAVHLYRQRVLIKGIDAHKEEFPLRAFIRMAAVTVLGSLAIIVVFILNGGSARGSMLNILTVTPLGVALVFGFQMDILLALMFWRKRRPESYKKLGPTLPV